MQQNENFAKQPEHAEAERPEFDESEREDMARIAFETAMANGISLDSFTFLSNSLAERYERIVGELRAVIAQLRQHKNDYMDSGQQTYRALQNEIREREAEIARLDGLVSGRTAERDAALARVAELTATRNRYGVDAHYFNKNLQRILRDFESFTPDELARSLIILAKVADEKVVAQAQRSVPEEFSFEYRHPNGECHTVTVSREQVINEMPDFLFEALCSKFCNCEPVGETNVVECCCDEYAEEFKLIAAAPGKEGNDD
ncbi:hypothetical protein ACM7N4_24125 [Pseudomonas aeruginosa]|uniref:hypothetical protein n=1 Tax=Pseudomonas aeruginosa TaxID=287 RepID=UPI002A6A6F13|nr:hypothetical protein [Pseudomonas aeruginosa]MDY1084398.1 hypothetical protein [Pseudomonas aeruginosa]